VDRAALCRLLGGTCVVPANCAILGLTLGYEFGRGSSSDVAKYFSCDASTICCYPFLLTSLFPFLARGPRIRNDVFDDDNQLDGGFEFIFPNNIQQSRLLREARSGSGQTLRRFNDDTTRRAFSSGRRSSLLRFYARMSRLALTEIEERRKSRSIFFS